MTKDKNRRKKTKTLGSGFNSKHQAKTKSQTSLEEPIKMLYLTLKSTWAL